MPADSLRASIPPPKKKSVHALVDAPSRRQCQAQTGEAGQRTRLGFGSKLSVREIPQIPISNWSTSRCEILAAPHSGIRYWIIMIVDSQAPRLMRLTPCKRHEKATYSELDVI